MKRARSNRSGFEQRLLKTLRALAVPPGERLAVAFSGGSDSLALAAALARIAPILRLELLLVHVDHRLRANSQKDAESCRKLADELGLPIEVVALEPGLHDRTTGIGLEEAARRERYLALANAAVGFGSPTLLLAHQANDQAETVLLHLFRGSGLDGLAGMRPKETRRIPWWESDRNSAIELNLVRPLLSESKKEIEAFIERIGLQPAEDETNQSIDFDRNWVRLEVLPVVLDRWPAAIETIRRSSEAIGHDSRFLDELTASALDAGLADDRTLCTYALREMHSSLRFRVLRRWITSLEIEDVGFDGVDRLSELVLSQDETRRVELGGGIDAVLADGQLTTFGAMCQTAAGTFPMDVAAGGIAWDIAVSNEIGPEDVVVSVPSDVEPQVRTVRNGDRWFGTQRPVTEDLRHSGVHPLIRGSLLAVATDTGVLLIPAIYPTIRSGGFIGPDKKVGVRWSKRS